MTRLLLLSLLAASAVAQPSDPLLPEWAADARDSLAHLGVRTEADTALAWLLDGFAHGRTEADAVAHQVVAGDVRSEPLPQPAAQPTERLGAEELQLRRALVTVWMALPGVVLVPDSLGRPPPVVADSARFALFRAVVALREPVLRLGDVSVVAANGRALAFGRTLDGERRLVAFNAGDEPAFLELPGPGIPQPWTPVFVSRDDAGRVPSLVALFDDDRATYGLKIPARTTVVYRPAGPADIRPRGLDE